jgi:hypothetical protein
MNLKRMSMGKLKKHRDRQIAIHPGLVMGLVIILITLTGCTFPSGEADASLNATKIALDVEATTLAMEKTRLAEQAGSQPEPTQPPPPTEPPPTEAPPPTDAPPEPTEAPPPTDTPEPEGPEAVEGSLVRAPYDPAYGWGAAHDADSFDGDKGKFPSSSAGAATAWYGNGYYNITFTSRSRWTWYWSFIDSGDFYMDVVIVNGDKCVPGDTAGMVFRGDSNWDYGLMFGISCGGDYFVGFTAIPGVDGVICSFESATINCAAKKLTHSDLIQTGPGAINRIGVYAQGYNIDYYINGKWVANRSVSLWAPVFDRGTFALYLGSAQKPDASVKFDDFSIWYLN